MANHNISNPQFNPVLRMFETSDRGHADVFNEVINQLINNDITLRNKGGIYGIDSENTNNYVISGIGITAYTDGLPICIKVSNESIEDSTLKIDELESIPIKDSFGNSVKLKSNVPYDMRYEIISNSFILSGKGGGGDAEPEHVLVGKKVTVDTGPIVGAMPNNEAVEVILDSNEQEYTIPKGFHNGLGKIKAIIINLVAGVIKYGSIVGGIVGTFTGDGTATASQILSGAIAYVKGNKIIGAMANRGEPTTNLNCGGIYNLQSGYYSGGKVTANSLASQTPANADASTIIAGRNAWVNGNLINGIATIGSLGGKKYATGTCSGGSTVNVGFRPEFVFLSGTYANKEAFACITPQNDTDGYPIYHDTTQSTYERWIKQTNNSKVSVTDTGFIVGFSTVSAWTYFCIG